MKIKLKNLKELIKHEKTKEGYCLDCNSDGCILDQLGEIEVDVMQWVMDKDKLAKEIEKELRKEFFSSPEIAEVSYFENNNEYDTMFKRWARAVEERLRGGVELKDLPVFVGHKFKTMFSYKDGAK